MREKIIEFLEKKGTVTIKTLLNELGIRNPNQGEQVKKIRDILDTLISEKIIHSSKGNFCGIAPATNQNREELYTPCNDVEISIHEISMH